MALLVGDPVPVVTPVLEEATDAVEPVVDVVDVVDAVEFVDVVGATPLLDGAHVTIVDEPLTVVVGAKVPVATTLVLGPVPLVSVVKLLATI